VILSQVNSILLTFDVEDWFQVENFKQCIPFSSWSNCQLRVEKNTHHLLDLLDSIEVAGPVAFGKPGSLVDARNPRATFFILGWIAQRLSHLVREIHARGHEVASHGFNHRLCSREEPDVLKRDLADSKKLLEDIIGGPVYGYRAPSFSVTSETLGIIEETGYFYDSSLNTFRMNRRYGRVDLSRKARRGISFKFSDTFYELPISNMTVGKYAFPLGGGAYFRLIPFSLFQFGVESILKREEAYLFYLHPWEIDSQQPKVKEASLFHRFRHYANLKRTASRLSLLIERCRSASFATCYQYLEEGAGMGKGVTATDSRTVADGYP
jgi:polysaccharide deacetylase family protein (PEP-CTERM system associated)